MIWEALAIFHAMLLLQKLELILTRHVGNDLHSNGKREDVPMW